MRALLDNFAVVNDEDEVGIAHGGETVRDDYRGAAVDYRVYGGLYLLLRYRVDRGCRLVEHEDARVGEGGDMLSTGEKQLLSFARALLADPRIFVLDEATSSVDTVTEQLIQNAIEKVMTGRTSFIIAHRLSTIRRADVILVVHDGKIIESGTHRSLMSAHGPYYRLYTRQYREEQTKSMMD